MSRGDAKLLTLWADGGRLEVIAAELGKTPTSIAHKLVRLGVFEDRVAVNSENQRRGGSSIANLEHDAFYTIYIVRNPSTNAPLYIGQTQNFRKRLKSHMRRFSKILDGKTPIIQELETVHNYAKAREVERRRIAEFSDQGFSLLNSLDRELCSDT